MNSVFNLYVSKTAIYTFVVTFWKSFINPSAHFLLDWCYENHITFAGSRTIANSLADVFYLPHCRWLIEVNASPSLTASSQEDYELKYRLLEDILHVVDMEGWYDVPKYLNVKYLNWWYYQLQTYCYFILVLYRKFEQSTYTMLNQSPWLSLLTKMCTVCSAIQNCAFTLSLTGREKQVGGFDLMWNDGPVYREDVGLEALGDTYQRANTHLGDYFNSI